MGVSSRPPWQGMETGGTGAGACFPRAPRPSPTSLTPATPCLMPSGLALSMPILGGLPTNALGWCLIFFIHRSFGQPPGGARTGTPAGLVGEPSDSQPGAWHWPLFPWSCCWDARAPSRAAGPHCAWSAQQDWRAIMGPGQRFSPERSVAHSHPLGDGGGADVIRGGASGQIQPEAPPLISLLHRQGHGTDGACARAQGAATRAILILAGALGFKAFQSFLHPLVTNCRHAQASGGGRFCHPLPQIMGQPRRFGWPCIGAGSGSRGTGGVAVRMAGGGDGHLRRCGVDGRGRDPAPLFLRLAWPMTLGGQ